MILISGASGKTGKAIITKLAASGLPLRAMVRREAQMAEALALGAQEAVVANLTDAASVNPCFQGVQKVYHICPNMSQNEEQIGDIMISAARANGINQFVYHSVMHPQVEAMPHHWSKMRVEEKLMKSFLPFTILQPAAYMQNVLGYWNRMMRESVYAIPYSIQSRSSLVDLRDLAEVVLKIMTQPGHDYATYELCACEPLSAEQIAAVVSQKSGKVVAAKTIDRGEWERTMRAKQMPEHEIDMLLKMFRYYEMFDFVGNCRQLTWLLGRAPTDFATFITQFILHQSVEE